jgi:hypothetical protein
MSDPQLPRSTSELLTQIEDEWTALMNAAERLTPEQMTTPDAGGWSPKDNLAHLSEWMNTMLGYHLDHRPAHEVMGLPRGLTEPWGKFDAINAALFERNRNRSAEDVLADLKRIYAQVVARIQSMPFDDLMKPRHADDPEQRPVLLWVLGDTTDHFAEHRATIEKTFEG